MSPRQPPGVDPYVPGRGSDDFRVRHYDLDLDYTVRSNRLVGTAILEIVVTKAGPALHLDLDGLVADRVDVDGQRVRASQHRARLRVPLPGGGVPGERRRLVIRYGGKPRPARGPWGEVGWEELDDGVIVAGQPNGAPTWFPCNDRPADKATFRIAVSTPSTHAVVCGGVLVEHRRHSGRTTWVYEQREPTAPYLATLQIGRYTQVVLPGTTPAALHCPGELRGPALHDLARQPEMIRLFALLYGPYPFARYDVVVTADDLEIPLEAQGLSIFGRNHIDGARGSERLVAHELAHQWFGNCLTVASWSDIWLNEGFACHSEWLWWEHTGTKTADEAAAAAWAGLAAQPRDIRIADPGPELMFDDRLYQRGALTLHALRVAMGEEAFLDLLRTWVARHRHGVVATADFVAHVRGYDPTGRLDDVLSAWIDDVALPDLPRRAPAGRPGAR